VTAANDFFGMKDLVSMLDIESFLKLFYGQEYKIKA
jgi:hypothetical protein